MKLNLKMILREFGFERPTLPPPAPNPQGNLVQPIQPQTNPAQQAMLQRREQMKQYEPIKRQMMTLLPDIESAINSLNNSIGSLRTRDASQQAQQAAQLLAQLQQMLSQIPVSEGKLNEGFLDNLAEAGISQGIEYANKSIAALRGGEYQLAAESLRKSIRVFGSSIQTINKKDLVNA